MRQLKILLLIIISIAAISCSNKSTYKITKVEVKPDSLYTEEANNFVGKTLTTELYDNSVKLTIEGQEPLFLKLESQNQSNDLRDNYMGYNGTYKKIIYDLSLCYDNNGNKLVKLTLSKMNKNQTDTTTYKEDGAGLGAALMASVKNKVFTTITAQP